MSEQLINGSDRLRWAIRKDLDAVTDLDYLNHELAWTGADYVEKLRQRNALCYVSERDGIITGAVVLEMHEGYFSVERLVFADVPAFDAIVRYLSAKRNGRRPVVTFDVPEADTRLHVALKAWGWVADGVGRGSAADGTDCYRFRLGERVAAGA